MAKKTATDTQLLTMHELAGYLHLDDATVGKLVNAGKIPAIQLDRQWRFKREAIDQWIADQLVGEDENFANVPDGMKQPLEDLLPDQAIITDLRAKTPIGVIEELAARAYTNGWLTDKPWFVGAVVERESLSSTAMEGGVAFLHTRAKDKGKIGRPFMIVGRSWEGIAFGAPDAAPTYLFFLLGLKYDRLHLPILGRLARALRNVSTIAKLRSLSSPDQMRAVLLKEDAAARAGQLPELEGSMSNKPRLDRTLRLRAIRRLQQQKKTDIETAEKAEAAATAAAAKRGKRASKLSPPTSITSEQGASPSMPAAVAKVTKALLAGKAAVVKAPAVKAPVAKAPPAKVAVAKKK